MSSSFQSRSTSAAGLTDTADSTESRSIGVLNRIVAGATRSMFVPTVIWNAPLVSGTMSETGEAVVGAGRAKEIAPSARMAPRPTATPARMNLDRPRAADA